MKIANGKLIPIPNTGKFDYPNIEDACYTLRDGNRQFFIISVK
ncbi:hypothetical protein [Bacillus smithii]|nr:hypothetical protein [Bacillus smithii]